MSAAILYGWSRCCALKTIARSSRHAPPPHVLFDALAHPDQDPDRRWLVLRPDEQRPVVVAAVAPTWLTWSSLWPDLPTARIRFDLCGDSPGGRLTWTLLLREPLANAGEVRRLRRRIDELVNGNLRDRFDA